MTIKQPVLIRINWFLSSKTKSSKRKYYQDGHYIRYITREDAVAKNDLSLDELKELKAQSENEEEYQQLLTSKINKNATGLWNKNGHLTSDEKEGRLFIKKFRSKSMFMRYNYFFS